MLEDAEWRYIWEVWNESARDPARTFSVLSEERRRRGGAALTPPPEDASPMVQKLWFLCAGYELFTDSRLGHPNYVHDLCVSAYGPPCSHCGKPLRTSKARFCAECGVPTGTAPVNSRVHR